MEVAKSRLADAVKNGAIQETRTLLEDNQRLVNESLSDRVR